MKSSTRTGKVITKGKDMAEVENVQTMTWVSIGKTQIPRE